MDTSALAAAAVFELEGEVVAINIDSLSASLHSAVIPATEVEATNLTIGNLCCIVISRNELVEVVLGIVRNSSIISELLNDLRGVNTVVLLLHLQEY